MLIYNIAAVEALYTISTNIIHVDYSYLFFCFCLSFFLMRREREREISKCSIVPTYKYRSLHIALNSLLLSIVTPPTNRNLINHLRDSCFRNTEISSLTAQDCI